MKYGQRLERESVPEWSLHNLDYNSLKHEIKNHTTRDQATAMAIPGQQDTTLRKFEDSLYKELCRQHDRLDLFVASKADEISRHLDHLSKNIHRWISKSQDQLSVDTSLKSQRRFANYKRELGRCGRDVQSLSRFATAQVVGFRKIIKKYRKWTGSTTLGSRFSENVLSDPKSFTRRNLTALHTRYDEISFTLHSSAPIISEPSSPESIQLPFSDPAWSRRRNGPPPMAEQAEY
ncbi:SPX domain-containing protein [Thelonectria olida]|uniref:SPX domain-containing protein n=1 Tax=Thelonectria olida TaxID=1576542 RepID=A0A9P8VXA2_9HYPO|nr:SPX domain-containing protein [Thelonectria olida]